MAGGGSPWLATASARRHDYHGPYVLPKCTSNLSHAIDTALLARHPQALRRESPKLGGSFANWGLTFSLFDCSLQYLRKKVSDCTAGMPPHVFVGVLHSLWRVALQHALPATPHQTLRWREGHILIMLPQTCLAFLSPPPVSPATSATTLHAYLVLSLP